MQKRMCLSLYYVTKMDRPLPLILLTMRVVYPVASNLFFSLRLTALKREGPALGLHYPNNLPRAWERVYPWLIRTQKVLVSACPWFWHDRFNRNLLPNYRFINRVIYAKHEFSVTG